MRRPGFTGDIWPDDTQELLLRAALLPGDRGLAAWYAVRPSIDVDHLPGELHRLMPLLSRALTTHGADDPDLSRLKGVYQFSWYRNTMLFTDGSALLSALAAAAVPTMLLRGAAVTVAHGADAGLRPMNDLDVLVPWADVQRARQVAAAQGWRPVDQDRPLERKYAAVPLRNTEGRVVRIHWLPSPHLALPHREWGGLWDRAVRARMNDTETRVPSPADRLVHACVDGAHADSGASLRWVADAMTILRAPGAGVDWDDVVAEARRLRVSLLMSETLQYLEDSLDASVPDVARRALEATPVTVRDRLAHRLSLTTTPRVAPAAEILGRCIRLTAHLSLPRAAAAVPGLLASVFEVERRRDLPAVAVRKVAHAVLSPAPGRASLSVAGAAGTAPRRDATSRG